MSPASVLQHPLPHYCPTNQRAATDNICYLRSPENTTSHLPCQLPSSFNANVYDQLEVSFEFEEKPCSLTRDGTLCVKTDCHYREYSVGFAFEGALIFLCVRPCLAFWFWPACFCDMTWDLILFVAEGLFRRRCSSSASTASESFFLEGFHWKLDLLMESAQLENPQPTHC